MFKRLAGQLGLERHTPPVRSAAERDDDRRRAEAVVRERATREAVAFQQALADIVIAALGIASAMTANDVHEHIARILSGSAATTFLDEVALELRRRRVVLAGRVPDPDHLAACLCSPMLSELVKRRLAPLLRAAVVGDDPDDGIAL